MFRLPGLMFCLFLVGCSPAAATTPTSQPEQLTAKIRQVEISLSKPAGWSAYLASDHLLLTESPAIRLSDGTLSGSVINIWMPPETLTQAETPLEATLQQILSAPTLRHTAATSTPTPFRWGDAEAAYYLLNSGDGNVSLVIALVLPPHVREGGGLLGINISLPALELERLDVLLPEVFADFQVNGYRLGSLTTTQLPQRIAPPDFNPNPEAALEVSPVGGASD